jgi:hypothetical protein
VSLAEGVSGGPSDIERSAWAEVWRLALRRGGVGLMATVFRCRVMVGLRGR